MYVVLKICSHMFCFKRKKIFGRFLMSRFYALSSRRRRKIDLFSVVCFVYFLLAGIYYGPFLDVGFFCT